MKIFLASDHAGFELKEKIEEFLKSKGQDVVDVGPNEFDPKDDYPDLISKAAEEVSKDPGSSKAIIFGGSGQAEAVVANKFPGVRCALFYAAAAPFQAADITGRKSDDPFEMIRLTREHNDANILSIGARFVKEDDAKKAVDVWLNTEFSGEERHVRRIEKIKKLEVN